MTATFCFELKTELGEFSSTFKSPDGEKYNVKITIDDISHHINGYLTLKWKSTVFDKFIRASFYKNDSLLQENARLVRNEEIAVISFYKIFDCNTVCISVSPRENLKQHKSSSKELTNQNDEKEPVVESNVDQLSIDMKNLLQRGILSDVVITDGSRDIHAHKNILSARSSVFERMFQNAMQENLENRVVIKDTSMEVLTELVKFVYTGTVTIKDRKMVRNLYVAADKYDIKNLRDICSGRLKSVNMHNILDTLVLADLYSDTSLKEAAFSFVFKNYAYLNSQCIWNDFIKAHQTLGIEVLKHVINEKM